MPTARSDVPFDASLTVRLLVRDPHFIDRAGRPWAGRRLALLAALLFTRQPLTRDELLDLLWSGDPPGADKHHRLRELIHRLRNAIPADVIRIEGPHIEIDRTRIRCDAIDFRACLDAGKLDAAIDLYEEDFFARGTPKDAPGFEDWSGAIRTELRSAFRAALIAELETNERAAPERYLKIAECLRRLDPDDPVGAEHVLRAALATNDLAGISAAARDLTTALSDGGVPPTADVRRLIALAESKRREPPIGDTPTFDPPFTGRADETGRIRVLLDRARRGSSGGVVGVAGQSGVGKTRLLGEIERLACIDGMRILRGRAYEVDWRTPYALVVDAIGPLFDEVPPRLVPAGTLETLATILPDLHVPGGEKALSRTEPDLLQIQRALADLLHKVSGDRPIVIIIDDAHWADHQSRACLHRIGLRTATASILLVLAYRDSHERVVAPLFAATSVELCHLQPFTPDEVQRLLESLAGFRDPAHCQRLVRMVVASSGGNPLQLIQHLSYLREQGVVSIRSGCWDLLGPFSDEAGRMAEPVAALIARRLESLSDSERMILAACAVLEYSASRREIATVCGLPGARIADQLDALVRQRLVQTTSGTVGLAHIEIGNAALRVTPRHRLEEMFEAALTLSTSDATRRGTSSLARLRLACGAGHMLHARLALLETLRDAGTRQNEQVGAVADEVLLAARDWSPNPDFFAELHRAARTAVSNPRRIDSEIRSGRRSLRRRETWLRMDRVAAAAILAMLVMVVVLLRFTPGGMDPPNFGGGGLLILRDPAGAPRAVRIDGPGPADTVRAEYRGPQLFGSERRLLSPDGRYRLVRCFSEGRDDPDACIETIDGTERRVIASGPGEDGGQGWSPDGNFVLVSMVGTNAGAFTKDIFIASLADTTLFNLSRDPSPTSEALWSPVGTHIVLTANVPQADTLIVTDARGQRQFVRASAGRIVAPQWSPDGARLAFSTVAQDNGPSSVWILDIATFSERRIEVSPGLLSATWSPDGRYLAATELQPGTAASPSSRLFLVADTFTVPAGVLERSEIVDWLPDKPAGFLQAVDVPDSLTVLQGELVRLPVNGRSSDGSAATVLGVTLAPVDSLVASSPGADSLFAVAPGETAVDLTAGGWRTARSRLIVLPVVAPALVFHEDWSRGIDTVRWKHYGRPRATVVDIASSRAMRNNGDASFPSGVVTRQNFSMNGGLALEWTQSTPLTGGVWEEVWIAAMPARPEEFHERPGDPFPLNRASLSAQTPIMLPTAPFANIGCTSSGYSITWTEPFDGVLSRTSPDHLRLQAYPSGGCDFFVNGVLRARLRPAGVRPWPDSVRIAVGGRSQSADILIGDFKIWQGVTRPMERQ